MIKYKHREDDESMALWQWAQTQKILRDHLIHIPNGGKRNAREAARVLQWYMRLTTPPKIDFISPSIETVLEDALHGI